VYESSHIEAIFGFVGRTKGRVLVSVGNGTSMTQLIGKTRRPARQI
jgi:hypothetical protein